MSKAEDLKQDRVAVIMSLPGIRFIRFKGAPLVSAPGTHGFVPLNSERFSQMVYAQFGSGLGKGHIYDLMHAVETTAPDWSYTDRYVAFRDRIWDMHKLRFDDNQIEHVFSSDIAVNDEPENVQAVMDYLLELADGDEALAHDYVQLLAPLFMYQKPAGIIWLLGAGANGKSAFLDALFMILGKHFAELSMDMLEDGRAAPSLRGILGNIVRESSEKRISDDKHYKNMGAHESFPIRVLGTHDTVTVDANFHTIMNANNAPIFEDKSMGSRRRTLLVPFPATFKDDPTFKERTFTPEFLGALVHLVLEETRQVAKHGYMWSAKTTELLHRYNSNANTAEAFARYLDEIGLVGFKNYMVLKVNYEVWCANQGMVALGRTHLSHAVENILKAEQKIYRDGERTVKRYVVPDIDPLDIVWLDNGYGMTKPEAEKKLEQLRLDEEKLKDW